MQLNSIFPASKIDLKEEKDEFRDFRFVKWLARHWKVLGIPPSLFYSSQHKALAQDFIRFCFYRKTETLMAASTILKRIQAHQD
jgi:kynurenine--oxoglutarate transaminase/cysteine-S-conjugate beta-lyase/glutamine--phenylpyruvate transaminase